MFGLGRPQPTSAEKIAAVENELKVVAEMHSRMVKICTLKCIDKSYREGDLSKGESVCLDRCAAKFFETHQKISDQLQKETQARGGGGFGM
ncbi:mitochondrial import inner membrane translocase subunit tim-10 [Neurospora crassa]|uniref:Mitochondrial import inner membrane translocase subunit tim10 n=2 Tax=Neurospora TaxID=5140 RepID=TIM10_NEUCR|nr:mitochondrial import inner membrane translocase subunit tim-10, variant [Neurospora crassa OR74A]XP_011392858.1 mitochondrial import inner membrane translocase subunit tim-10 [Neurospora crassa OR74A]Q9C0N3.1 RecName: Full=Mitochondrial import inner membrane translocase subunit tim10 [Neurospora crassa OR74A]AAK26645.1 TIM10 [Neurospora crassa]AAK26646.1 TIM10 [Neurospora crassa]ESA44226.1 mitochondrial import inner membrane translocase subunit tim-10 [Neurospora crassa OR74A]ESA44227.1 mi|eukprot:XP_011392857.1 mitochondrial import inner membrane translocase subunit tim-10, variant [Neurospora crassa OR74A]